MIVNDGSGSISEHQHGDSDFSLSSGDEEHDDKLRELYNFWRLEMCKQMKNGVSINFKKRSHPCFAT